MHQSHFHPRAHPVGGSCRLFLGFLPSLEFVPIAFWFSGTHTHLQKADPQLLVTHPCFPVPYAWYDGGLATASSLL